MLLWKSYSPARSTEDPESGLKSPIQLSNWLAPRRLRTVVVSALFLLSLCLILFRYPNIHDRVQELRVFTHFNTTAPSTISCNCSTTENSNDSDSTPSIRWSDFAYVQYVTDPNYLCNSLMIFEALKRFETKADLLMMYPQDWTLPAGTVENGTYEEGLLAKARDLYSVNMVPIRVKTFENEDDPTWQDSYTKLLAFNQTQYKRVISLDSDATLLQHVDELFLLPSAPVAMPRAYWMDKFFLSSQVVVIEPSEREWKRVEHAIDHHQGFDYDMDILNKVYGTSSSVIPHRQYDLLTGELKGTKHANYLGSPAERWNAKKALQEAKYVHFSDWPMPKPWLEPLEGMIEEHQPPCRNISAAAQLDCSDQEVWLELRRDFTGRRKRVCGRAYDGQAPQPSKKRSIERLKYEPIFE